MKYFLWAALLIAAASGCSYTLPMKLETIFMLAKGDLKQEVCFHLSGDPDLAGYYCLRATK